MGEAAPQHDSAALGVEHALISAFRVSTVATAYIPGDIPSLLRHAYSRHFNKVMPVERDAETTSASASSAELESLQTMLSRIPPLKPTAQALLDRARSIIADGPPLSMNVELAEGQELPVALHTLLQGTLWAVMIASGADPDLEDRVLEEARVKWPDENAIHDKIRNALAPEAKCLWFLCRKFFFTLNVAAKNGLDKSYSLGSTTHRHLRYQGRQAKRPTSAGHSRRAVRLDLRAPVSYNARSGRRGQHGTHSAKNLCLGRPRGSRLPDPRHH
ncbi:hypothetical protein J8273_5172 [Carpediemonas membranifera]|uniref:Uncharacterized protein n=1 Tax=Carpediemonas membranifera TaxID=201153 RepID=A0A8J6AUX1_9EUKA|nr:hypothetical protein J8273_5172 [Carpediemonas membranifera]|eukprot:KAG9392190.1 hypothetical protein J8273_5172 [Carpediemonas membranifera]